MTNFSLTPVRAALGLDAGLVSLAGLAFTGLVLLGLLRRQRRENTAGQALVAAAVLLLVAGWCGPFLHENYLGVFLAMALLGVTLEPAAA